MTDKTIDTLVPDIYKLLEEGLPTTDGNICEGLAMKEFLSEMKAAVLNAVSDTDKGSRGNDLRLSQIGYPDRKIYYNSQTELPDEKLGGSTRMKFLYGHMLEALLIFLTKTAGHKVEGLQKEVAVGGVTGHQDAMIDDVVVDVKSASTFSFNKFKSGSIADNDAFGYIGQLSAYADANDTEKCGWLVVDKSTGELAWCVLHPMEMINAEERVHSIKSMLLSDTVPPRCYDDVPDGMSGNRVLAIGCVYCNHKHTCWSDSNGGMGLRRFKYSNGPKDFTQVWKEPRVDEIAIND